MHKYFYDGPVYSFDTRVHDRWMGETMAPSEAKAKSNLAFRFKREYGRDVSSKIRLPNKLKIIE